jgi:hypothetical protein
MRQGQGPVARSTFTLYPAGETAYSKFAADMRSGFLGKESYGVYISTENGYEGKYVELTKEGNVIFDFVEVPESNSYAVSFYDTSGLPSDEVLQIKRAFEENFLEVKIARDGEVKKVKLDLQGL